jgi:pimeloyl-ACP methyl ester carboxylesterase
MSEVEVNGVKLHHELRGDGEPLALVHGSWVDASDWQLVVDAFARSYRVLIYDRRGHSRSEPPSGQGSVDEDRNDLEALLEALDLVPAHVVTNSFGGNVALGLAARRPELFRSLTCHEPPLIGVIAADPEGQEMMQRVGGNLQGVAGRITEGDHEGAARQFVEEIALGPGAWEKLPPEDRKIMAANAPTFLDELNDPNAITIDDAALEGLQLPVHLTGGTESPPMFGRVLDRLGELTPRATRETIEGAGHIPHIEVPERYVEVILRAVREAAA